MTDYAPYDPTSLCADLRLRDRQIVVASGANASGAVLRRGTVLGRVTATDKYVVSVKTANDGSQVPAMVLAFEIDASAADVICSGYDEGEFVGTKMTFDASWTAAALEAALRASGSKVYVR